MHLGNDLKTVDTVGSEGVSLSAVTCNMTRSFRIPEYWAGNSHWQPTETRMCHEKRPGTRPTPSATAFASPSYLQATYRIVWISPESRSAWPPALDMHDGFGIASWSTTGHSHRRRS